MDDLPEFGERLGVPINDYSLLLRALTHRSYLNENQDLALEDNERLEFLGDAVLDFVVGAYLYNRFPEMREGELTMLRAALVRTSTLALLSQELGIGEALKLGHGEQESGGRERLPVLCAAFEAVVGAVFLDQGLEVVEPWLQKLMAPTLAEIIADAGHKDAKSEFQIWAQARFNITPRYQVLSSEGPDHEKTFTVAAQVEGEIWGVGQGRSKQAAEQRAASAALAKSVEWDGIRVDDQPVSKAGA
jgi:ribonuclease-3